MGVFNMITSVNLNMPYTNTDLNELIAHKPRMVRMPVRNHNYKKQFETTRVLLKNKILPLLVFDIGAKTDLFKNQIDLYVGEFKASVCYEVLNEPLAMQGSSGYCKWASPQEILTFTNKWIDYIHARIGKTSVCNPGIANVFEDIELELLKLFIKDGHQDILSLHVYDCKEELAKKLKPILANWHNTIWITEFGTKGTTQAKEIFANDCSKTILNNIHTSELCWYNYTHSDFSIKDTELWPRLF